MSYFWILVFSCMYQDKQCLFNKKNKQNNERDDVGEELGGEGGRAAICRLCPASGREGSASTPLLAVGLQESVLPSACEKLGQADVNKTGSLALQGAYGLVRPNV